MKKHPVTINLLILACFIAIASLPLFANKSDVSIELLGKPARGAELTIRINVTHNGNNFLHHTDWVYVTAGGKEIGRWEFTRGNLPESGNFTREVKIKADRTLEIAAEAHCNIHGSAGLKKLTVPLK